MKMFADFFSAVRSKRRLVATLLPTLVFLACSAVPALSARAQTEPPKPAPGVTPIPKEQKSATAESATPTGTIRGQLVASDGQPFTNANVMVQSLTGTPAAKPSRPDAEGNFAFEELLPGSYLIIGTAPGYIDESTALQEYTKWPRHLIGSNVRLNMIRGGVVTGLVTNAKGEPMVGVPVRATLVSQTPAAILGFLTGGNFAETDDRGIYRIYGLLPGQYVVDAGGSGRFGQFSASGFDSDVPTYYPTATRDTAVPVSVRSGDETTGIDIKYRGTEGHAISGFVLGDLPPSRTAGAVTIFLSHPSTGAVLSLKIAVVSDPKRAFSFNGVADGDYEVFASFTADPKENALVSIKRVTVRGVDVTGLELRLTTLASFAGTIALEPIKPEDKCDKRGSQLVETFLAAPRDEARKAGDSSMLTMLGGGLSTLNEKGEFAMHNLEAGKYRLDVRLPSDSWYIHAINIPTTARPAGTPAAPVVGSAAPPGWQGVVTLKAGEQLHNASILVGQDAAGLRGRLVTEGAIKEGTTVHLVPVDREQANNVLRYSEATVKSDGTFALKNLAPGRYLVLARVEALGESDAPRRPVSWDAAARAKLRREAEAANVVVELKPCQKMVDYQLKSNP